MAVVASAAMVAVVEHPKRSRGGSERQARLIDMVYMHGVYAWCICMPYARPMGMVSSCDHHKVAALLLEDAQRGTWAARSAALCVDAEADARACVRNAVSNGGVGMGQRAERCTGMGAAECPWRARDASWSRGTMLAHGFTSRSERLLLLLLHSGSNSRQMRVSTVSATCHCQL